MTLEDAQIDPPVHDLPERLPKIDRETAHRASSAARVAAQGRRLRSWLIVGNLMAWMLIILAAHAVFS